MHGVKVVIPYIKLLNQLLQGQVMFGLLNRTKLKIEIFGYLLVIYYYLTLMESYQMLGRRSLQGKKEVLE